MTTTLAPEPKTTTPTSSPAAGRQSDGLEPAARIPADRVEGHRARDTGTGRARRPCSSSTSPSASVVGRKRKPVIAINDVSMRLERGDDPRDPRRQRQRQVDPDPARVSGLLTLDKGRVEVFGHDLVREETAVKRLINRVCVDAAFFKKLSPMENLCSPPAFTASTPDRAARGDPDPRTAGHLAETGQPADRADEPGHAAEGRDRAGPADEPDPAAPRRADHRSRPAQQARRPDLHRRARRDA